MTVIIFHGGDIITMDNETRTCEAVVIEEDRITGVGKLRDMQALAPQAELIDLQGNTLLPGFIDAHSHILWAAKTRGEPVVDIRAITEPTFAKVLAKIRRRLSHARADECLVFFGLDAQLHPDMVEPTREMLDEIAPDNPIAIQTSNCHAVYLNSAAMALCHIDKNTPDKPGGVIVRDKNGVPTGKVMEATTWDVLDIFYGVWGESRLSQEFETSAKKFLAEGITTVTEHLYLPYYKSYYQAAAKAGLSLPRIAAYQQATSADMQVDQFDNSDNLWMAGVKIHADGSPFIGNIWLSEPYLDTKVTIERMNLKSGHTGGLNYSIDYFTEMVRTYFNQGWQMSVHTQGDKTIDMVLNVIEDLLAENPRQDHRFRLEHCALMREDQIQRAQRLGVVCSFFISHIRYWGAAIEDYLFGPERASHYMPVGTAIKHGMPVSLHADTPMTDATALGLVQTAINRKTADGRIIGSGESISAEAALRAVTIDAAWQLCKEDSIGSISVGKYADLVILDDNPLTTDPDDLHRINIVQTWIAGKNVYIRNE